MNAFRLARALALALPVALMAGALGSQYIAGLYPCEMCHWQRWPHYAAIVLAALAFVVPGIAAKRTLVALAALGIAVSGAIGVFHAGVEYHWWEGITACTTRVQPGGGDFLDALLKAPIIRCDVAQWTLGGISLAGFNAIFSLGGAVAILALLTRRR
ncbi:disulfide bond formation protein B [Sphingomonas sp. S1-29]|uniref:disulfide bond formation protein B n=1 Tax=Sphingomonas sp. S1-29 TaxID=2991074 RepID=UPI0022406203|nr:disulfide bond formation protein B [Sphingomonas sp. S1-29]UZK68424.1 disulfide bond formation protein B [Sphingomonas sp. S1-29]